MFCCYWDILRILASSYLPLDIYHCQSSFQQTWVLGHIHHITGMLYLGSKVRIDSNAVSVFRLSMNHNVKGSLLQYL